MNEGYQPKYRQQYPRKTRLEFWVSEEELDRIRKRMAASKFSNMSAYLRNIAINGYAICVSDDALNAILPLFHRLSSNTNQIAKRINESGRIYGVDVQELLSEQKEIGERLRQLVEITKKNK